MALIISFIIINQNFAVVNFLLLQKLIVIISSPTHIKVTKYFELQFLINFNHRTLVNVAETISLTMLGLYKFVVLTATAASLTIAQMASIVTFLHYNIINSSYYQHSID